MKVMERNKSSFWYMLYVDSIPVLDEWGNETGGAKVIYSDAVQAKANISPASGSAQIEQFGNSEQYDKVIVTDDLACPITENSVLFIDKEPGCTEDGTPLYDYVVKRVAKSLNSISIAVSKVKVS